MSQHEKRSQGLDKFGPEQEIDIEAISDADIQQLISELKSQPDVKMKLSSSQTDTGTQYDVWYNPKLDVICMQLVAVNARPSISRFYVTGNVPEGSEYKDVRSLSAFKRALESNVLEIPKKGTVEAPVTIESQDSKGIMSRLVSHPGEKILAWRSDLSAQGVFENLVFRDSMFYRELLKRDADGSWQPSGEVKGPFDAIRFKDMIDKTIGFSIPKKSPVLKLKGNELKETLPVTPVAAEESISRDASIKIAVKGEETIALNNQEPLPGAAIAEEIMSAMPNEPLVFAQGDMAVRQSRLAQMNELDKKQMMAGRAEHEEINIANLEKYLQEKFQGKSETVNAVLDCIKDMQVGTTTIKNLQNLPAMQSLKTEYPKEYGEMHDKIAYTAKSFYYHILSTEDKADYKKAMIFAVDKMEKTGISVDDAMEKYQLSQSEKMSHALKSSIREWIQGKYDSRLQKRQEAVVEEVNEAVEEAPLESVQEQKENAFDIFYKKLRGATKLQSGSSAVSVESIIQSLEKNRNGVADSYWEVLKKDHFTLYKQAKVLIAAQESIASEAGEVLISAEDAPSTPEKEAVIEISPEEKELQARIEKLHESLVAARTDYVQMEYKQETAWASMKRFFGNSLPREEDADVITLKNEYQSLRMDYVNARLALVRLQSKSADEVKIGLVQVLKEIEVQEHMELYDARVKAMMTPEMAQHLATFSSGARLVEIQKNREVIEEQLVDDVLQVVDELETINKRNFKSGEQMARKELMIAKVEAFMQSESNHIETVLQALPQHRKQTVKALFLALVLSLNPSDTAVDALTHGIDDTLKIADAPTLEVTPEKPEAPREVFLSDSHTVHTSRMRLSEVPQALEIAPAVEPALVEKTIPVAEEVASIAVDAPDELLAGIQAEKLNQTLVMKDGNTVVGLLSEALQGTGLHPWGVWTEYARSQTESNPFFVSDRLTMSGANVVLENGKIKSIIDKQGAISQMLRNFSDNNRETWGVLKNMTLEQALQDKSGKFTQVEELMVKYRDYLGDDMPVIASDATMKDVAKTITKAYFQHEKW